MSKKIRFSIGLALGFALVELVKYFSANNNLWAYFYK